MKKRLETNRANSRKWKLTITVLIFVFSLVSLSAAVSEKGPWVASIEKNKESVVLADHSKNPSEGNWIHLSGGKEIQLPKPLNFNYDGPSSLQAGESTIKIEPELGKKNNAELAFTYPYSTHPFYTEDQKVAMDFNGSSAFGKQKVDIYLVKGLNIRCAGDILKDAMDGKTISLKEAFDKSTDSYHKISATLDKKGDLVKPITFDSLEPGSYGILITLADKESEKEKTDKEVKVLSGTCFEVVDYKLKAEAAKTLEEEEDLKVNLRVTDAPANGKYTYAAILIREDAYKADVNLSSDGTRNGTDIFINDIGIVSDLRINSTDYDSTFSKTELTKDAQTLIGEGNGAISVGDLNQKTLTLTTLDLIPGDYLLFTGAYEKGKGLVGVDQKELTILT